MFTHHGSRSRLIRHIVQRQAARRLNTNDGRHRWKDFWIPPSQKKSGEESSNDLLITAGFIRKAHSGIFHLMPMGLRVIEKIERLIDKHMRSLGAAKVSLSSLSSEEIWAKSGRLQGRDSEFFRLSDRKGAKFLLSPTHEEEITSIVANTVHSHNDLPLRLYQISRKYRDEARPRQGLLRGREFLMKDLYTFDSTEKQAIATYEDVRKAYRAILDELKLPYLVADADSGNMGGNLSHEYHFVSATGEDEIINCESCGYAINEELYMAPPTATDAKMKEQIVYGVSIDREQMIKIVLPENEEVNYYAVKKLVPQLDTSVEDPLAALEEAGSVSNVITIVDPRCEAKPETIARLDGKSILLSKARNGDQCPKCSGSLHIDRAVEIGHTFHLSTRYSSVLNAQVLNAEQENVPIQMGCHGIGVSRLVAAIAALTKDAKGLNWPMAIAPFGAVLISVDGIPPADIEKVYDSMTVETIIDDRKKPMGWRLNDADLLGYPFIVVLGRRWKDHGEVQLQCRRLGVKEDVRAEQLTERMAELVKQM